MKAEKPELWTIIVAIMLVLGFAGVFWHYMVAPL